MLGFPDGRQVDCKVQRSEPHSLFEFSYFESIVTVQLESDQQGGTDLTVTNWDVPERDYQEVHAGWLSVLLPLKAAADFNVDLRNHDGVRTWRDGYVDQ